MVQKTLIGQQFGCWTILAQTEDYISGEHKQKQWLCKCTCGYEKCFTTYAIKKENKACSHIWGKRFGHLTVIEPAERPKGNKTGTFVKCKCDCGNDYICNKRSLIVGDAKSCGCSRTRLDDLTGQRFGSLLVVNRAENKNESVMWNCKCDCGNDVIISSSSLKKGKKSCGCIKIIPKNFIDLTGQRFGRLLVIAQAETIYSGNQSKVTWKCKCDCGNEVVVKGNALKSGVTQSCGCIKKTDEYRNRVFGSLLGQKFQKLTVLKSIGVENERRYWLCQCSCGKKRVASTYQLTSGEVYDCGHTWNEVIDLVGNRYGRLTVVEKISSFGASRWKCKCDCGNYKEVYGNHLKNGNVQSCGCLAKELTSERSLEDITGQRFGLWTVIERVERPENIKHGTYWRCKCDCGNEGIIAASELKNNKSMSCGCKNRSKYEMWTEEVIHTLGYDYQTQIKFDDLTGIGQGQLSYDFGIYRDGRIIALIECQGLQHYEPVKHFGGDKQFERQQLHDALKLEYAEKYLMVPLIEIPYWINDYQEVFNIILQYNL